MYYKLADNDYIYAIGIGYGDTEITENEYNQILGVLANKPEATETTDYRLRSDLTWESYEVEQPTDTDLDDSEALSIILGGAE